MSWIWNIETDGYSFLSVIAQKKQDDFETYNLTRKTITFFDGLTDLSECYKIYTPLKENAAVDKKLKGEEVSWKEEDALKKYYIDA